MSKNSKIRKSVVFGKNAMPNVNSDTRKKHMSWIKTNIYNLYGIKNRVTKGKLNQSGKFIKKPDWTTGWLEYEPNPDAAIHELGHLFLMPQGMSLAECQQNMDKQFGFVQTQYGYMKQKRSFFEVLPMAMEQKIRRRLGLPPCTKAIKVKKNSPERTSIESNEPIARRIKKNGSYYDLIRLSSNLDTKCLERLEMIDNGELIFDIKKGWIESNSIDAKINKRARLKKKVS